MDGSFETFSGTRNMAGSSEIASWDNSYGWKLLDIFLEQELRLAAFRYFPETRTMDGSSEIYSGTRTMASSSFPGTITLVGSS
jgi:hypothetical protein